MSQETRGAMALRERDVSACRRTSTNRTSSRELLDSPKPQPTGEVDYIMYSLYSKNCKKMHHIFKV